MLGETEVSPNQPPANESNSNQLPTVPLPIQMQVVEENQSPSLTFPVQQENVASSLPLLADYAFAIQLSLSSDNGGENQASFIPMLTEES